MNNIPNKEQIREYLISNTIDKMVEFLMIKNHIPLELAMDKVYTSETIKRLQNKDGELFIQSPNYMFELITREFQ